MLHGSLDEREFELINIIGSELATNQRDLSRQMNLSLGMINLLIRRLLEKGYIRMEQLNQRRVLYLLTPKGFSEKLKKSIKYTIKTIHSINLIRRRLKEVVSELFEKGEREFFIFGESDLAVLVGQAVREAELKNCRVEYLKNLLGQKRREGTLLVCKENVDLTEVPFLRHIDILTELAKASRLSIAYNDRSATL